jgi:stress response protein SCP2
MTKIEEGIMSSKIKDTVDLLKQRPGEFARRLDKLIRDSETEEIKYIINAFYGVSNNISTTVLLQVMNHFKHRNDIGEYRIIIPKGDMGKIFALKNNLDKINDKVCNAIYILCCDILIKRFMAKDNIGKCYVDKCLKNYNIPFSMRSSSSSLKQLVRGSSIPFDKTKSTIRMFTWWRDILGSTVDLDLSAVALDKDMKYKNHISYTNLKNNIGCHSGDITSAPNGASEFIDINIKNALKDGMRYIVMNILSYKRQPFNKIPEVSVGWMMRDKVNSGEIYEPKTVDQKISLNGNTTIMLPAIFDLVDKKVYWADISLTKNINRSINVENNMSQIELMAKSIINIKKPNLYDLIQLHVKGRGEFVDNIEDADIVYDEKFAYEYENIISNYI